MSGSDWEPDEDGYPSAPLPPHERAWRHPSELSPMVMPVTRPMGRATLVGAGVVSIALIAGLVQLLLPRSGGSGVVTQGTSSLDASTVTADRITSTASQLRQSTTAAPRSTQTPVTAAPSPSTVMATMPAAVPTMVVLTGARQSAVPIGDGHRALTTAGTLAKDDALDVQLDDGTSAQAVVVKVDAKANVAVLELKTKSGNPPPMLAQAEPHHGDAVVIGASVPCDGVLEKTDEGMVVKMSQPADEGAPIIDANGALVGLASTDADGTVHLVSIADAIVVAYSTDPLVVDVWLGVAFNGEGLVIDAVQVDSPAAVAGVQVGDILMGIGATPIEDMDVLWEVLAGYDPEDIVTLLVDRAGELVELPVTLAERPS